MGDSINRGPCDLSLSGRLNQLPPGGIDLPETCDSNLAAEMPDPALTAERRDRLAESPAVSDQEVVDWNPVPLREDFSKDHFGAFW